MKRLILTTLLLATPAMAQQGPTPEQYIGSLQVSVSDSLTQIKVAFAQRDQQIAAMSKQAEADKKQIADLTKQVADAKAATATAPVKADAKP